MTQPQHRQDARNTDPDVLQIVGAVADLLGLGEHMQRLMPLDRLRQQRRHQRIDRLRASFSNGLENARTALRSLTSTVPANLGTNTEGDIGFGIASSDLPIFTRALDQLQIAIQTMTRAAYELEAVTAGMPEEVQRYYRVSQAGRPVLEALKTALERGPAELRPLLERTDRYLTRCAEIFGEGEAWRQL